MLDTKSIKEIREHIDKWKLQVSHLLMPISSYLEMMPDAELAKKDMLDNWGFIPAAIEIKNKVVYPLMDKDDNE